MHNDFTDLWFVLADKVAQIAGSYLQELYGSRTAGDLLSSLSRLWTIFLQGNGFSCGISDLLLTPAAESKRTQLTAQAECKATCASAQLVGLDTEELEGINNSNVRPLQSQQLYIFYKLSQALACVFSFG